MAFGGFLTANLEAFAIVVNLQFTGNEQFTTDGLLDRSRANSPPEDLTKSVLHGCFVF